MDVNDLVLSDIHVADEAIEILSEKALLDYTGAVSCSLRLFCNVEFLYVEYIKKFTVIISGVPFVLKFLTKMFVLKGSEILTSSCDSKLCLEIFYVLFAIF